MSNDTPPQIEARRLAVLAGLRPEDRLMEALRMSDMVQSLAAAGRRFREDSASQARAEAASDR